MEVKHRIEESKGAFYIDDGDEKAAEMTYSKAGNDKFIIDHTEVDDAYRGKMLGLQLVKAAVEYARQNSMKIMPLCPFAKKMFDKHSDLQDVLW